MREFNLDLLIGKNVAVNCKTIEEVQEFLEYLGNKGVKWKYDRDMFSSLFCIYNKHKKRTCFHIDDKKDLSFGELGFYGFARYKILSLDDLVIKPKNNFKEYGFEADFEGEILSQYQDELYGVVYRENGNNWVVIWSSESGKCYNNDGGDIKKYNLKPIKKEWYLDKDNFEAYKGKIIINKYGNIRMIQSIDENKVSTFEQNMYHDILRVEEWKPATKEEVLSLLVKE